MCVCRLIVGTFSHKVLVVIFVELLTIFEKMEQIVPLCCLATAKQLDQL